MEFFGLIALSLLLALQFLLGDSRHIGTLWILVAAAIPAALVCINLDDAASNHRFGDLHISLDAVHVSPDAFQSSAVTLGSDPTKDAVLVSQVSPSLVAFDRSDNGNINVRVARNVHGDFIGAVAIDAAGEANEARSVQALIGERQVRDGEPFCLGSCARAAPCRVNLTWRKDHLSPASDEPQNVMPAMPRRLLFGFPNPFSWTADQRIYSIRTFLQPSDGQIAQECADELSTEETQGVLEPAFLFRKRDSDQMYGLYLDKGRPPQTDAVLTPGGPARRIHIYHVDYADPGATTDDDRLEHIAERRSVLASVETDGTLTLKLDTPEFHPALRAENIATTAATKHSGEGIILFIDSDRPGARAPVGDATLQFSSLAGPLAETALGRIALHPSDHGGLAPYFTIIGGGDTKNRPFGAAFSLGHDFTADFTLSWADRDQGGLTLIHWPLMLLLVAAMVAATWETRRRNASAWRILVLAETLLSLRLLVAISAAFVDPVAANKHIVETALFAYAGIPYVLAGLTFPRNSGLSAVYGFFVFLLGALLKLRYGLDTVSILLAVCVVAVALRDTVQALASHVAELHTWLEEQGNGRLLTWGRRQRQRFLDWLTAAQSTPSDARILSPFAWRLLLLIFFVTAVRLLLRLINVKEGFPMPLLGFRVALSTPYVLLSLLLLSPLMIELIERSKNSGSKGKIIAAALIWCAMAGLLYVLPAIVANDTGYVIYGIGIAIATMFAFALTDNTRNALVGWGAWFGLLLGLTAVGAFIVHIIVFKDYRAYLPGAVLLMLAATLFCCVRQQKFAIRLGLLAAAVLSASAAAFLLFRGGTPGALLVAFTVLLGFALWLRPSFAWAIPLTAVLALAIAFRPELLVSNATDRPALQLQSSLEKLREQNIKSANDLRIWYNVKPTEAEEIGTAESQDLGAVIAHLRDYTACPSERWPACLLGTGFLSVPPPTVLAPYHINDNVTAIHLIAPFGRGSAFALLLLMAFVALLAGATTADWSEAPMSGGRLAGIAALWTLFGVTFYMILANTLLMPFTGKSAFFLAAGSGTDLIEGSLLLVLAMVSLARRAQ